VARGFWQAIAGGDFTAAAARTRASDPRELESALEPFALRAARLEGETLRNEQRALVETRMDTRAEGRDLEITFYTHLDLGDEGWKVDFDRTRAELQKAAFVAGMREFGEALGETLENVGEAIESGVREMRDALREALEELESGRTL
jgi:hypothetical protein